MSRSSRLRNGILAGALSFGALMALAPLSSGERSATAGQTQATATPSALAARTISLDETGHLHLTSKHGFTLNEQGSASGTITGTIYVHLTIASTSSVTAEVNIYPSAGSISGKGSGGYLRGSTMASFSGSMSISRGTGSYAHAHGSGLSFSGTIQKSNDAITVHVSGRVSD